MSAREAALALRRSAPVARNLGVARKFMKGNSKRQLETFFSLNTIEDGPRVSQKAFVDGILIQARKSASFSSTEHASEYASSPASGRRWETGISTSEAGARGAKIEQSSDVQPTYAQVRGSGAYEKMRDDPNANKSKGRSWEVTGAPPLE